MSKHKMDAKKALQNYHAKEWTYDTCPGWIMDESTGVNYEKGIDQNEIIGFLFGFLAGCKHVEKMKSKEAVKSFEDWYLSFSDADRPKTPSMVFQAGSTAALEIGRKLEREECNKDLQDAKRLIKELVECCEDFELRNKHLMGCGATVQYGGGCNCMDREYYSMRSCEDRARSCLAKNQDAIKKFGEGV